MALAVVPMTVTDLHDVLAGHARFWGERDLRALHQPVLVHEFPDTCLVARGPDGVQGYLIGFVTPDQVGYVHLIATRDDARGLGIGRALHEAFVLRARALGATRLKAITSVANEGSIDFHTRLGFAHSLRPDYDGSGESRIVFTRALG